MSAKAKLPTAKVADREADGRRTWLVCWPTLRGSMYYVWTDPAGAVVKVRTAAWSRPVQPERLARIMPDLLGAIGRARG